MLEEGKADGANRASSPGIRAWTQHHGRERGTGQRGTLTATNRASSPGYGLGRSISAGSAARGKREATGANRASPPGIWFGCIITAGSTARGREKRCRRNRTYGLVQHHGRECGTGQRGGSRRQPVIRFGAASRQGARHGAEGKAARKSGMAGSGSCRAPLDKAAADAGCSPSRGPFLNNRPFLLLLKKSHPSCGVSDKSRHGLRHCPVDQ